VTRSHLWVRSSSAGNCTAAICDAFLDQWQVDDLGGLLAIACANARNIEASRGLLGFLNTLGGWALRAAHAARSNTISGALVAAVNDGITCIM
jgi:hypothetical protein